MSFAQEYEAHGISLDNLTQQIRLVSRGYLIPFKILSYLAGIEWAVLVAEVEGEVVGFGSYMGRRHMELANLMVHPDFRRRGIGQTLLESRLKQLTLAGHSLATTTILATNEASLGNVKKQGFQIFDSYSILETTLPLPKQDQLYQDLVFHPVQPSDKQLFTDLETEVIDPSLLQILGTKQAFFFPSWGNRMMNQFGGSSRWVQVIVNNDNVIGFIAVSTSRNQSKGLLTRPVIRTQYLHHLPEILHKSAEWLAQQGKTAIQVSLPNKYETAIQQLEHQGWVKTQSWLRLVKHLDKPH